MFFGLSTELDAFADNIHTHSLKGVSCTLHLGDNCIDTMIPIPGNHMVYNALAGALVGRELGLTAEEIDHFIFEEYSSRFVRDVQANWLA